MKEQVKTMKKFGEEAIFDARALGGWRFFVLGFQHLFAMFGATVLVPLKKRLWMKRATGVVAIWTVSL